MKFSNISLSPTATGKRPSRLPAMCLAPKRITRTETVSTIEKDDPAGISIECGIEVGQSICAA